MDQLEILSLTLDKVFAMDRVPERKLSPPDMQEDTRSESEIRVLVAERLDSEAFDPDDIVHALSLPHGARENLFAEFRTRAANAIDLDSKEAYEALGRTAAEIVYASLKEEV